MKKVLILSVGGSADPIINAIKVSKPDLVYFFCSSGPTGSAVTIDSLGDPCGDKRKFQCPNCGHEYYLGDPKGKAIVFQAGLEKEKYEIVTVDNPDDLSECYLKLLELVGTINEKYPGCEVIANYTGGTKTMSVAMALVSVMSQQWDLSLNIGPRLDLIQVRSGDVPVVIDKWKIFCQSQLDSLKELLKNYYYDFVSHSISDMLGKPLDSSLQMKLMGIRGICLAFDFWDKFLHQKALELLEPYGARFSSYIIDLKRILGRVGATGYEMVSDLLNNAERRATQGHYDDAVARIYRATELFAQIRLETKYGYKTGELKLENLPNQLQKEYKNRLRNGKLILGLREDYELLFKLDDPLGNKFKQKEPKIINALTRRNSSISAHGLTPLLNEDYVFVKDGLKGFILEAAEEIGLNIEMKQLPKGEIL